MSWKTDPKTFFVKAGEAIQVTVSFGDRWNGPQFVQAVHDAFSSGTTAANILVMQWEGVVNDPQSASSKIYYAYGVQNASTADVWFHLEGGTVS